MKLLCAIKIVLVAFVVISAPKLEVQAEETSTSSTTSPTEAGSNANENVTPAIVPTECSEAPSVPVCAANNITQTSAVLSCNLTTSDKAECQLGNVTFDCGSENKTEEVGANTTTVNNFLTELNASTLYSCSITVKYINGSQANFTNVSFTTDAIPVPSEPLNLQVNFINSTSFNITWDPPEKNSELVNFYWVFISNMDKFNESHYVGTSCEPSDLQRYYEYPVNETYFTFSEAFSDFRYLITVFATTDQTNGTMTNSTIVTPSAESMRPTNLSSVSTEYTENLNVIMQRKISWEIPCNTNGPGKYFVINWTAYYSEDGTLIDSGAANLTYSINSREYNYTLENLAASSSYSIFVYLVGEDDLVGDASNLTFETGSNYPNAPTISILNVGPTHFTVAWTTPTNHPGNIFNYTLTIYTIGPNYTYADGCRFNHNVSISIHNASLASTYAYASSYYVYNASVRAATSRGEGKASNITVTTTASEPGKVSKIQHNFQLSQNLTYNAKAYVTFTPTCDVNGPQAHYKLEYAANRPNYPNISKTVATCNSGECMFELQPQYSYNYTIVMDNGNFTSTSEVQSFISPSGVPQMSQNSSTSSQSQSTSEATITFSKQSFDWSQGDIQYVAIIVSDKNISGGDYKEWDGQTWPEATSEKATVYYQATGKWWNPWVYGEMITFTIGNDTSCTDEVQYCNRPLRPGTQYYVFFRAFTNQFYSNSFPMSIQTERETNINFVLGMIFGLLLTVIVLFVGFILWRKGIIRFVPPRKASQTQSTDLSLSKFIEYCTYLEQNPDVLKKQYADLCVESEFASAELETTFAQKPENKRKNRYINILPYDHTRVKLLIDEDDEMCSDYINASYIKGYDGQVKYISTQGPLHSTCRDFWKMILQEEARIIVMVARFVEGHKEKCFKYFPKKGENMLLGDDMEVRCCTELDFGIYCIRSLQIRKDLKQITVTHMQFLQWPDFGVPTDPQNILQFYQHFKQRWAYEGGPAIIHCSAGVGRTGTLIATDILLQAIKAGSKIDVYNTVLELRKQRVNMVQTEKQYMFIYSLVKNIIEDPMNSDEYNDEHFYENIDILAYKDQEEEEEEKEESPKINEKGNIAETEF